MNATKENTNLGTIDCVSDSRIMPTAKEVEIVATYLKAGHIYILNAYFNLNTTSPGEIMQGKLQVVAGETTGINSDYARTTAAGGGGVFVTAIVKAIADTQINAVGFTTVSGASMTALITKIRIK